MKRWFAGFLLVLIGWLVSPDAVPIYDGLGTDQPYKYGATAPAASLTVNVSGGKADAIQLLTSEQGPQFRIDLQAGSFTATTPKVTIGATPFVGDGTLAVGSFDSNAYRVTATAGAALDPNSSQGFLLLRAGVMTAKPAPVIVHRLTPTDPWTQVATTVTGRDVLATPFKAVGDYAVVRLPGSKTLAQSGGLSSTRLVFLGGGVLLLIVITVLVLRRPQADDED